jgi:hypothetical protein
MRPLATLGLAALCAAALAACGNDEANAYVDQVNALQDQIVADVTEVVGDNVPSTPEEAGDLAGQLAEVFSDAADEFDSVDPPEEVADLHSQLVEQINAIADQVEQAEDAFTSGSEQAASQAAIELQNAGTAAQTELDQIIGDINNELQN